MPQTRNHPAVSRDQSHEPLQEAPELAPVVIAPSEPPLEPEAEAPSATPEPVQPEPPLSSLDADALKAMCASLNAQIIALHEEGKHEEGDSLRLKHLNAIAALKAKANPLGYA